MTNTKPPTHLNGGSSTEYTFMRAASNVNTPDEKLYLSPVESMEHTEDREEEACGWLGCRPSPVQRFRHPRWVLVFLCWAGAIQVS